MTLGERIRELRQEHSMSQEDLAEALGVSRQAVSKWEKNLSYPDTGNLLALAELFGVSADGLAGLRRQEPAGEAPAGESAAKAGPSDPQAGTNVPRRRQWWPLAAVALAALLIAAIPLGAYLLLGRSETRPVEPVEKVPIDVGPAGGQSGGEDLAGPFQRPGLEETGEFALLWEGAEGWEYLALGRQTESFPFGTTLAPTEVEEVSPTDSYGDLHEADCGDVKLQYLRWEEESGPVEAVWRMTTIMPGYGTPRGIQVGSRETEVLDAYGDELLYHLKEDSYTVAPHDDYYTYTAMDAEGDSGFQEIAFFIQKGEVAALGLRLLLDEGFEGPDNLYSFPVVDGEPDFSARREPEKEEIDQTRAVYIALHALQNQTNLSAEEAYQYRRDIYSNLQYMSWQEFGRLGEAGKSDEAIFALLNWLAEQDTLSEDEICGLQAGGCRTDLDGAYTDSYCIALARAFLAYPEAYVKTLAGAAFTDSERQLLVGLTGYGCDVPEDVHQAAVEAIEELVVRSGALNTPAEAFWGEALRQRINTPL